MWFHQRYQSTLGLQLWEYLIIVTELEVWFFFSFFLAPQVIVKLNQFLFNCRSFIIEEYLEWKFVWSILALRKFELRLGHDIYQLCSVSNWTLRFTRNCLRHFWVPEDTPIWENAYLLGRVDSIYWTNEPISILKGIVHFETNFWYVLAYLKGIQDVGVFVSTVFSMLTFLGQTVLVFQSYTVMQVYGVHLKEPAQKSKLNMI